MFDIWDELRQKEEKIEALENELEAMRKWLPRKMWIFSLVSKNLIEFETNIYAGFATNDLHINIFY